MRRLRTWAVALLFTLLAVGQATGAAPSPALPELTGPVNDFAHVIDPASARELDRAIRALMAATGDVVTVVTVPTVEPYADEREYAREALRKPWPGHRRTRTGQWSADPGRRPRAARTG